MRAAVRNPAVIQDHNPVGLQHGSHTLGDNQLGAAGTGLFQCRIQRRFRLQVQGTCGVVEDQDLRIPKHGAGYADPLLPSLNTEGVWDELNDEIRAMYHDFLDNANSCREVVMLTQSYFE